MAVVGIDLGTTNTVIAAVREGRAAALKDKHGNALLPSVVSFTPKGTPKVGLEAKARRTIDPENTVFSVKRLIGRTFDSEHVQKAKGRLPFQLKGGPGKSTLVSCYGLDYTLPKISALVLGKAQEIAENRLGEPVGDAVITVPANFNDLQRAATKVAGRTAGLEVLRIINEPTAAALAYGYGKTGRERIAVYDFGGGTFDITLLDLSENVFEVLSTAGDTFLGGDDIDRAILDRMSEELLRKQKIDASADNLIREQLRAAAEKVKIELSMRSMAKVSLDDLDFDFTLRRSEFEKLAEPLIARTLLVCQEALEVAGVAKKDLDQILLVGGSSRIPLVRRRISSFFGKMPQSRINPDEVVALGAAIQASALEAKQEKASILPAPRPRASMRPTAATAADRKSTTKMGLAGLKKTLPGAGTVPDELRSRKSGGSLLSSLKSNAPGANRKPGMRSSARPDPDAGADLPSPARPPSSRGRASRTQPQPSGVGRPRMGTLAGVGRAPLEPEDPQQRSPTLTGLDSRSGSTTNLGLGEGSASVPPNAEDLDFEEITIVQKNPIPAAATPNPPVARTRPPSSGPMFPQAESSIPPSGDGSVTFDLGDLEASEDEKTDIDPREFDSLDNEPTAIMAAGRAEELDSQVDNEELTPEPVLQERPTVQEPEEIGDSALFSLGEDVGDESADLPVPAAGLPVPRAPEPEELGDSALIAFSEDENENENENETDLPSTASGNPKTPGLAATRVGLPARAPDASPARGEPTPRRQEVGLPSRAAGLPTPLAQPAPRQDSENPDSVQADAMDLPLVGGGLPSRPQPSEKREAPGGARAQIGTPGAGTLLPSPSVDELDELSVSAPLPTDDDEDVEMELGIEPKWASEGPMDVTQPLGGINPPDSSATPFASHQSGLNLDAHRGATSDLSGGTLDGIAPVDSAMFAPSGAPFEGDPSSPPSQPAPQQEAGHAFPQGGVPLLLDVTPLSLGVEVVGGYVDRLIERNSPVPCERTRTFATAQDNQQLVRVRVSQGEDGRFEANTILGEVELTGIPAGPRGSVKVDVSFSLDESGMLQVSARDQTTGNAANARLMLSGVAT